MIKDEEERVLIKDDLKILERWREYYQKLMNADNPREGRNEQRAEVEGDIIEITSADIEMALNLPVEVWKSLGKNWSEFS